MTPKAPCPAEVRLRYSVTPDDTGPGLVPWDVCLPAHNRENLGLGGRRVSVSRQLSGKTLTEHRADRREVVARCSPPAASKPQTRTGSPPTAPSPTGTPRNIWADSDPDDTTYAAVIAASLCHTRTWRSQWSTPRPSPRHAAHHPGAVIRQHNQASQPTRP